MNEGNLKEPHIAKQDVFSVLFLSALYFSTQSPHAREFTRIGRLYVLKFEYGFLGFPFLFPGSLFRMYKKERRVPAGTKLTETEAESPLVCLMVCNLNEDCFSVSYSAATKKCLLSKTNFFWDTTVTPEEEAGSVIFALDPQI